jgi:pyruvate formate lyase activating enzyme
MSGGIIFDIRRYSVHDGPGIRSTVFFKGCPLNCLWCHNPESIMPEPQPIKRSRQLNGQKEWVEEMVGRHYSAGEVMDVIGRDLLFYEESGGGVTFSGGEPLMQAGFLLELLALCREAGIHTAVDTSGHAPEEVFKKVSSNTDLLLFDIKTTDNKKHEAFTGMGNELILNNFHSLNGKGPSVMVRIPVIPGFNDTMEEMQAIIQLLKSTQARIESINLLPYHRLGRQKYEALGLQQPPVFKPETTPELMKAMMKVFEEAGYQVKLGG